MNAFDDPFEGKSGIYQFTMSHLPEGRIFRKEEDYIYGVNSLALATTVTPVQLLGYVLMSNHLHLLLKGIYLACCEFYYFIIRRLRRMLSKEYQLSGVLHESAFNVSAVTDRQMFVNELAYILRNAYKARLGSPYSYRWSSADVYFNPWRDRIRGTALSAMSQPQLRKLLKSHRPVPGQWEQIDGCIMNRCFVDYPYVEKALGDSLVLFDKLRVYDLESAVRLSHGFAEKVRFSDFQLQEKIRVICQNEYHVSSLHQLDRRSLFLLARTLVRRFGAGKSQLRRLLSLSDDILDQLL